LTKLGTNHPWGEGIINYQNEGDCHSPRGDNHKKSKNTLKIFKNLLLQNQLGINHPWIQGILNYSNKGSGPLQRGDNLKNAKIGWGHLKIFFSRTTEPE
jgi:hypothetical protein